MSNNLSLSKHMTTKQRNIRKKCGYPCKFASQFQKINQSTQKWYLKSNKYITTKQRNIRGEITINKNLWKQIIPQKMIPKIK